MPLQLFMPATSYRQIQKLMYDSGQNWQKNTSFGPIRHQSLSNPLISIQTNHNNQKENDSLYVQTRIGLFTLNYNFALYGYGYFTYDNHFYGYLYPRIVNNHNAFPRYSGRPRDIPRFGFNSGETDLSGIGFQNGWLLLQFCRGRQSWGSGNDIQLVLSDESAAYDYGKISLDFGNVRM